MTTAIIPSRWPAIVFPEFWALYLSFCPFIGSKLWKINLSISYKSIVVIKVCATRKMRKNDGFVRDSWISPIHLPTAPLKTLHMQFLAWKTWILGFRSLLTMAVQRQDKRVIENQVGLYFMYKRNVAIPSLAKTRTFKCWVPHDVFFWAMGKQKRYIVRLSPQMIETQSEGSNQ